MIWVDVELIKKQAIATDELDNPIYEDVCINKCKARYASITKQEIDMDNRLMNQDVIKIIIKSNDFKACDKVKIKQDSYHLLSSKRLGTRFVSVYLEKYG